MSITEMHSSSMVLTSGDHNQFIETGYLVCRGLIPPEVVQAAVAAYEAGLQDTPDDKDAVNRCTTDLMLDAIGELFGPAYPFTRSQGGHNMQRPYEPEATWDIPTAHVDDSYPTMMPGGWAVGSFIFLTPVRTQGGAFIYFPGSYLRYRQIMAAACHCVKGAAAETEYSGPYQEFLAEPGDVMLFHHIGGHCGSTNITDMQTRHALLNRWHPIKRIVPGDKPFDEMSTIEKVNSARYLSDRLGLNLHGPPVSMNADAGAALRDGISCCVSVRTYAILHYSGRAHLFFVDVASPSVVRHWTSTDFLSWTDAGTVPVSAESVRALQIHQYTLEVVLSVTYTVSACTRLYTSNDLVAWDFQGEMSGLEIGTPWYIYPEYPSKIAGGQSLFTVPVSDPEQVVCRWGENWADAGEWETRSVAARTATGEPVRDVTVAAYMGDSQCAIIVDIEDQKTGETRPYYTRPKDVAIAEAPLRPLPYDGPAAPCHIRIFNRARGYWLVTYLGKHDGENRLFWGAIDWAADGVMLKELSTVEAFNEAKEITGFI